MALPSFSCRLFSLPSSLPLLPRTVLLGERRKQQRYVRRRRSSGRRASDVAFERKGDDEGEGRGTVVEDEGELERGEGVVAGRVGERAGRAEGSIEWAA
jgi:hypothetical protein